jgi:hypothetical protein
VAGGGFTHDVQVDDTAIVCVTGEDGTLTPHPTFRFACPLAPRPVI